jgi:hypothetical protein
LGIDTADLTASPGSRESSAQAKAVRFWDSLGSKLQKKKDFKLLSSFVGSFIVNAIPQ